MVIGAMAKFKYPTHQVNFCNAEALKCLEYVASEDFIDEANIQMGDFDNVRLAKYAVPSHWDIGKVYKRLILGISKKNEIDIVEALMQGYNSFVSDKIDDYNSSFYYDAPQNILNAFIDGEIE